MTSIYSSQFVHRIKLVMDPSPWPMSLVCAINAFIVGMVSSCHLYYSLINFLILGFILFLLVFSLGIRDLLRDFLLRYEVIPVLMESFRNAFILFIISEVMFFLAFFGAFFHSSLAPTIQIGSLWPPLSTSVFNPWGVPLVNTIILLTSGATTTWVQYALIAGEDEQVIYGFIMTLLLSVLFLELQVYEYVHASFGISDGIYGSVFYLLTGFHGFHVLIGTVFLSVSFCRYLLGHFTPELYLGFTLASGYGHFVDVVWILLFLTLYLGGNTLVYPVVLY